MRQNGSSRGRRQYDMEGGTFALDACALDPDAPAHRLGQFATQIQAQSIANGRRRQITWQAHKTMEEERRLIGWDAQPIVAYHNLNHALLRSLGMPPAFRPRRGFGCDMRRDLDCRSRR